MNDLPSNGNSPDAAPRILVVDGSRVARRLIGQVLKRSVPQAELLSCGSGEEALQQLAEGPVDLITLALLLPDMDGLEFARRVRSESGQAYMPIIVVSGDVQSRLVARELSDDVTDYFDKSLGFDALGDFIGGYVSDSEPISGRVLYVEDSRVVAFATRRMMERHGLQVDTVATAEEAVAILEASDSEASRVDLVLTDVTLKTEMTGGDLLDVIRQRFGHAKGELPVLVMTGEDNPASQAALLRAGANDLVLKPIEERVLIAKLMFQLRVSRRLRARAATS